MCRHPGEWGIRARSPMSGERSTGEGGQARACQRHPGRQLARAPPRVQRLARNPELGGERGERWQARAPPYGRKLIRGADVGGWVRARLRWL